MFEKPNVFNKNVSILHESLLFSFYCGYCFSSPSQEKNKKVIFFYFSIKPFFISCVKETIRIHKLNFYYIV